jgi:hypothetical protein
MARWYRQSQAALAASVAAHTDPRNTDPVIPARRAVAVLLAALTVLVLASCGSSDQAPSTAQGILKDTFGPGKPVKSGKLDLAVSFDATGLSGVNGPVRLALRGPFQSQGGTTLPAFDFDLSLAAGGTNLTAGATSTGKAGFLKFQGTSYALGDAVFQQLKKGYEASAKSTGSGRKRSGPSLSTLGVDPLRWLDAPKKVGTESVGGTDTNHVSATVNVPKLLADVDTLLKKAGTIGGAAGQSAGVPDGLTAAQRKTIEDAITGSTFDVWAGKKDGILRKLDVSVAFTGPAASQAKAGGLQKGRVRLTMTIADLNADQTIEAPSSTKPLSELQSQVSGLLGGLTGGATTTTPGTSSGSGSGTGSSGTGAGTSGGTGTQSGSYTQCLQAAGTDIAKVNDCAKLLGR